MEFTLHKQLKQLYAGNGRTEVRVGSFRVDAIDGHRFIEIQIGSLAGIRHKIHALIGAHPLVVVKPLMVEKLLINRDCRGGRIVQRRLSPKREAPLAIVHELIYLARTFPHPHLTIETPLTRVRELRYPGRGRRRRACRNSYQVEDIELVEIVETRRYRTADDLLTLTPPNLSWPWNTADLAKSLAQPRWIAQRLAYCLRQSGIVRAIGKCGNARIYDRAEPRQHRHVA